jgi:hypothetical protein
VARLPGVESSKTTADTSAICQRATHYNRHSQATRHYVRYLGVSMIDIRVHNNTARNLERGLAERVFNVPVAGGRFEPPPVPSPKIFNKLRRYRRALADPAALGDWRGLPLTREEFVASCPPAKRKLYEHARLSLGRAQLSREDSYMKTFVKAEKINFSAKPDPAPRVIQPRDPRYNLEVGRYLRPLEHKLYDRINELWGHTTVFKNLNGLQSAQVMREKWEHYSCPVALGIDANRFDQHVSAQALKFEHSVYQAFYPLERDHLGQLLSWQLVNHGRTRSSDNVVFSYNKVGSRMSGDMNTSLGNCLLMCVMLLEFKRQIGVDFMLANNGDDCQLIFDAKDVEAVRRPLGKFFMDFGFSMKIEEPVYQFEHIVFCQTQPVHNGSCWVMVRQYPMSLAKDTAICRDLAAEDAAVWRWCLGSGGVALYGDMPILSVFYRRMRASGRPGRSHEWLDTGFARMSDGCSERGPSVDDQARFSFYLAFGVLPQDQIRIEEALGQWSPRDAVVNVSDYDHVGVYGMHPLDLGPR